MYFPLEVGDVVIRRCQGGAACDNPPSGWSHLSKDTNDDAIFRMVTESQPSTSRAQRRAAARHKHRFDQKKNGTSFCECGAKNEVPRTDLAVSG